MSKSVLILDYGHGNANSIKRALNNINCNAIYSNSSSEIQAADAIIMPGVGHFQSAMQSMIESQIISLLNEKICHEKIPVLGICLGFQLMANFSEEGDCKGLGWIKKNVKKISPSDTKSFKVPHIGWRTLENNQECELLQNVDYINKPFYFCHKFAISDEHNGKCATYKYDKEYIGLYEKENIFGVQFHPEKSQAHGQKVIENFINLA